MWGSAWRPTSWTSSSKPSTPLRAVAWASDCPSAVPSSKSTVVVCGLNRTTGPAPRLLFPFPRSRAHSGRGWRREEFVMVQRSLVSVVDDDQSVRESLPDLLRHFGFAVQAFSSAEAFLASEFVSVTRCLILDVTLVGMSGPDLQRELIRRRQAIPTVFITAHGDTSVRSRLLALGATECLFKPFSDDALLDALTKALGTR